MYKVLIVDDEVSIREGLKTIIPWNQFGFHVEEVAVNGKDALQKYQAIMPDLMIVDIRMPAMDGLELIKIIRESGSSTHFLILTGYADFEYARRSIQYRVDGYLLKPVDEEELIESIGKVRGALENKRKMIEGKAWKRERFIHSLILNDSPMEMKKQLREGESLGLNWKKYQVLLVNLQKEEAAVEPGRFAETKQIMSSFIEENQLGFVFTSPLEPYIGILLKEALKEESEIQAFYHDLSIQLIEWRSTFLVAAGQSVDQITEVRESYEVAASLLKRRFFVKEPILYSANTGCHDVSPSDGKELLQSQDWNLFMDKFFYAIDIGNIELVQHMINQLSEQMINAHFSEQMIKKSFVQLTSTAVNRLLNANPQVPLHSFSECALEIYDLQNIYELKEHVFQLLGDIIRQLERTSRETVLKQMIDFIHRNYNESLRLDLLAELFNYNSAYLGKMFKKYTGEYFNTYLDKVRIEKSKELLLQGMKVYEVAERIGYHHVDYFHSKFKKYVGSSPSSYKKIYK